MALRLSAFSPVTGRAIRHALFFIWNRLVHTRNSHNHGSEVAAENGVENDAFDLNAILVKTARTYSFKVLTA